jgi:hypothetical protein
MTYVVASGVRNKKEFSTAKFPTAKAAYAEAINLERSDEEIKVVDTPTEGRVDMRMLKVLAERER